MSVRIRDFLDVAARARELGCQVPVGIALLPGNFSVAACASEFCYHAAIPYVRSAWRRIGLKDEGPDLESGISAGHDRNSLGIPDRVPSVTGGDMTGENGDCTAAHPMGCSEGLSPFSRPRGDANNESASGPLVAFFGRDLRSGPGRLVTYALGAVASVLSAHTGEAGAPEIRLDAIVERPGRGSYACIEYRGDACELVALAGAVREILMGIPGTDDDEGA